MEIITPELQAVAVATTVSGSAVDVAEDIDTGVRFPLAAITNRIQFQWAGGTAATPATDGRYRAIVALGTGVDSAAAGGTDDINSAAIAIQEWQSIAQGTPANWAQLWVPYARDWYSLTERSRPLVVDGWSFVIDNIDGAAETVQCFCMVSYQIVRLTSEEFAALRAATP